MADPLIWWRKAAERMAQAVAESAQADADDESEAAPEGEEGAVSDEEEGAYPQEEGAALEEGEVVHASPVAIGFVPAGEPVVHTPTERVPDLTPRVPRPIQQGRRLPKLESSVFDREDRHGLILCHRRGCRVQHGLYKDQVGPLCAKHLAEFKRIRAKIQLAGSLFDVLHYANEEFAICKHQRPEHAKWIAQLERQLLG